MKLPSIVWRGISDAVEIKPKIWIHRSLVVLIIMLIVVAGRIFLNLGSDSSEKAEMEKVAFEKYKQYSQKLDELSKRYAKEMHP
jgi:hypothetical protein